MTVYEQLRAEILASLTRYEQYYHQISCAVPQDRAANIAAIKGIIHRHDQERLAEKLRYEVKEYVKSLTFRFVRWVPGFTVTDFQSYVLGVLYEPKNCEEQLNIRLRDEARDKLVSKQVRANAVVQERNNGLRKELDDLTLQFGNKQYELDQANKEISRLRVENAFLSETLEELYEQTVTPMVDMMNLSLETSGLGGHPSSFFAKTFFESRQVDPQLSVVQGCVVK